MSVGHLPQPAPVEQVEPQPPAVAACRGARGQAQDRAGARGSPAGSGEAAGPGRGGEVGSGARVEGGEAVQLADGLVAGVVPGPRHLHEALADVRQRGALY